jgi:hypothetical protein
MTEVVDTVSHEEPLAPTRGAMRHDTCTTSTCSFIRHEIQLPEDQCMRQVENARMSIKPNLIYCWIIVW